MADLEKSILFVDFKLVGSKELQTTMGFIMRETILVAL